MPKQEIPKGYLPHATKGYHYKENLETASDGSRVRHIYYFNNNTGAYTQAFYPVDLSEGELRQKGKRSKAKGFGRFAASALVIACLLTAAVFGIRFYNTNKNYYKPAPEEIERIIGIAKPDPATHPEFLPYEQD